MKLTSNTASHNLSGKELLASPRYNKGTAFTHAERERFGLLGLLPSRVETIAGQAGRSYEQYRALSSNLAKNLFLNDLFATNVTLFYYLVSSHLAEMLPVVYTPTIGDAVKQYSRNYVRPQGMIISLDDQDRIDAILAAVSPDALDIAVVTDGEGVLGIGDQGIGGLNIAIGKLMVYTLCGGLNPHRVLPVQLDAGTNNAELLADPLYLGLRRQRATGEQYQAFIDKFVSAFKKRFPRTFLHWEDLGRDNARAVLERHRDSHPSFNDDIQGTGAVALAAVLSGINKSQKPADQHRFCIFGAGTAGCGIADQISKALAQKEGKDPAEIRRRFYLIDREGLLTSGLGNLPSFQVPYAISPAELISWKVANPDRISLVEVVRNARPTVLIGCSAQSGAFTDEVLGEMARNCDSPVIMPLSNPTEKAEATPQRIFTATRGRALVATGSPFDTIDWQGQQITVSQCNNALVFPGIGLGMLISQARQLSDTMLLAASSAVSRTSDESSGQKNLLPGFDHILQISRSVALEVARAAITEKVAPEASAGDLEAAIRRHTWVPEYSNTY